MDSYEGILDFLASDFPFLLGEAFLNIENSASNRDSTLVSLYPVKASAYPGSFILPSTYSLNSSARLQLASTLLRYSSLFPKIFIV